MREGREGVREARGLAWAPKEHDAHNNAGLARETTHTVGGLARGTVLHREPRKPRVQRAAPQAPSTVLRPSHDAHAITSARSVYTFGVALPRALPMEPCVPGKGLVATHWRPGTKRVQEAIHTHNEGEGAGG